MARVSLINKFFPSNNAIQGPYKPFEDCPYGTPIDLAAGAVVGPHGNCTCLIWFSVLSRNQKLKHANKLIF